MTIAIGINEGDIESVTRMLGIMKIGYSLSDLTPPSEEADKIPEVTAVYSQCEEGHWHLRSLLMPFFFTENPEAWQDLIDSEELMVMGLKESDTVTRTIHAEDLED